MTAGSKASISYSSPQAHSLYVGTRGCFNGATLKATIDGSARPLSRLLLPAEDVLQRIHLGDYYYWVIKEKCRSHKLFHTAVT
jgi:hypothetical protein